MRFAGNAKSLHRLDATLRFRYLDNTILASCRADHATEVYSIIIFARTLLLLRRGGGVGGLRNRMECQTTETTAVWGYDCPPKEATFLVGPGASGVYLYGIVRCCFIFRTRSITILNTSDFLYTVCYRPAHLGKQRLYFPVAFLTPIPFTMVEVEVGEKLKKIFLITLC